MFLHMHRMLNSQPISACFYFMNLICRLVVVDDDDEFDGMRLRLWTADTNGPIVHL
jgi:hypothetical protein